MWPRLVEMMLGFWLLASPFIFRHSAGAATYSWKDFIVGFLVVALSLLSYSRSFQYVHLITGAVGVLLVAFGHFASRPVPPELQSDITIGLVLLMLALIPNEAGRPPRGWRTPESGT